MRDDPKEQAERNCPCCGESMVRGYITLSVRGGPLDRAELDWHNEYPGHFSSANDTIMKAVCVLSGRSSAKVAGRCPACRAVVIEAGEAVHPEWSDPDADLFHPGADTGDR